MLTGAAGVGVGVDVSAGRSKTVEAGLDVGDGFVPERSDTPDSARAARAIAAIAINPSAT